MLGSHVGHLKSIPRSQAISGADPPALRRPVHRQSSPRRCTVSEVEVDQSLVRNLRVFCQFLEIGNRALIEPNRHLAFQKLRVGVTTALAEVILFLHGITCSKYCSRSRSRLVALRAEIMRIVRPLSRSVCDNVRIRNRALRPRRTVRHASANSRSLFAGPRRIEAHSPEKRSDDVRTRQVSEPDAPRREDQRAKATRANISAVSQAIEYSIVCRAHAPSTRPMTPRRANSRNPTPRTAAAAV